LRCRALRSSQPFCRKLFCRLVVVVGYLPITPTATRSLRGRTTRASSKREGKSLRSILSQNTIFKRLALRPRNTNRCCAFQKLNLPDSQRKIESAHDRALCRASSKSC
jgi:hypothetical protein